MSARPTTPSRAGGEGTTAAPPAPPRRLLDIIRLSGGYLEDRGVRDGRLNAEHLLAHVLGLDRLHLYLAYDRPLTPGELARYRPLLRRRGAREPLQYILGSAPFRNLELEVGPGVAIPRPETEYLVDVVRSAAGPERVFEAALDVGTGSGCIAIALAEEGIARTVTATDVSADALRVARRNARRCGHPEVDFRSGALLEPVGGMAFDLVLSNPPYLADDEWRTAEPEVREWEPRTAMVAPEGGLGVIRGLVAGLEGILRPGGWVGMEVGIAQTEEVATLLRGCAGLGGVTVHEDLARRPRYVLARAEGG